MARKARIEWTEPALNNLFEIARFIMADDPAAAIRFAAIVRRKVGRPAAFPSSGRMVPEFPGSDLREIILGDYRVIYRIERSPSVVRMLTVRHGARRLEPEAEGSTPRS